MGIGPSWGLLGAVAENNLELIRSQGLNQDNRCNFAVVVVEERSDEVGQEYLKQM